MRNIFLAAIFTLAGFMTAFAQNYVIVDTVYAKQDRCTLYADTSMWFIRNIHYDKVPCMKSDDGTNFLYCTDMDTARFQYHYNTSQYSRIVVIRKKKISYVDFLPFPNYKDTLLKGKTFDQTQQRDIPAFTYQSADAPELQALRMKYNLDSVAGTGDEVTRILNVLHWVHNKARHNGSAGLPKIVRNTETILKYAKKRDVNCRGLALFANECYLALGFRARVVTCKPKTSDGDCHVINEVYSEKLGKWLWIDPTFEAYVSDENSQMLGIFEVRERIIQNQPVQLNPNANWNNQNNTTKEDYLDYYMAKNLYYLTYNLHSEYGSDTQTPERPLEYLTLKPMEDDSGVLVNEGNAKKGVVREYYTNNPNLLR